MGFEPTIQATQVKLEFWYLIRHTAHCSSVVLDRSSRTARKTSITPLTQVCLPKNHSNSDIAIDKNVLSAS